MNPQSTLVFILSAPSAPPREIVPNFLTDCLAPFCSLSCSLTTKTKQTLLASHKHAPTRNRRRRTALLPQVARAQHLPFGLCADYRHLSLGINNHQPPASRHRRSIVL